MKREIPFDSDKKPLGGLMATWNYRAAEGYIDAWNGPVELFCANCGISSAHKNTGGLESSTEQLLGTKFDSLAGITPLKHTQELLDDKKESIGWLCDKCTIGGLSTSTLSGKLDSDVRTDISPYPLRHTNSQGDSAGKPYDSVETGAKAASPHGHSNYQKSSEPSYNDLPGKSSPTQTSISVGARTILAKAHTVVKYSVIHLIKIYLGGLLLLHLWEPYLKDPTCNHVVPHLPGSLSEFPPCLPENPPIANPFFVEAMSENSALAEMQRTALQSKHLPSALSRSRHEITSLLIELRAAELPSADVVLPLASHHDSLVDDVINKIQNCQANTHGLIDRAIIYLSWAKSELRKIDSQGSSLVTFIYPPPLWTNNKSLMERRIEEAFYKYTENLEELTEEISNEYQDLHGSLAHLRTTLVNIASALVRDREEIQDTMLSEESFWKDLFLRSHRNNMRNLDKKAKLCADFIKYTEDARGVVGNTMNIASGVRSRLGHMRRKLKEASMRPRGEISSLGLTLNILESSVSLLQASKPQEIAF